MRNRRSIVETALVKLFSTNIEQFNAYEQSKTVDKVIREQDSVITTSLLFYHTNL